MRDHKDFYRELRRVLADLETDGNTPRAVRMHSEQRRQIEGEFGIEHQAGGVRMGTVPLIADDDIPFGDYKLDE